VRVKRELETKEATYALATSTTSAAKITSQATVKVMDVERVILILNQQGASKPRHLMSGEPRLGMLWESLASDHASHALIAAKVHVPHWEHCDTFYDDLVLHVESIPGGMAIHVLCPCAATP
jgi:hypothetical protein